MKLTKTQKRASKWFDKLAVKVVLGEETARDRMILDRLQVLRVPAYRFPYTESHLMAREALKVATYLKRIREGEPCTWPKLRLNTYKGLQVGV